MTDRNTLKTYFNLGDKPTEPQFHELIDAVALSATEATVNNGSALWDSAYTTVKGASAGWTPDGTIDVTKLPLSGGTMSGNIDMGANGITFVSGITGGDFNGDNVAVSTVNATAGASVTGGIDSFGDIDMKTNNINFVSNINGTNFNGTSVNVDNVNATTGASVTGGIDSFGDMDMKANNINFVSTVNGGDFIGSNVVASTSISAHDGASVYGDGGNSAEWSSAHTTVQANSATWAPSTQRNTIIIDSGPVSVGTADTGTTYVVSAVDVGEIIFNLPSVTVSDLGVNYTFVKFATGSWLALSAVGSMIDDSDLDATIYSGSSAQGLSAGEQAFASVEIQLVLPNQWHVTQGRKIWTTTQFA
jgi:hypothetical protein